MSWERFHQITGWILEPSYPLSQTPMFQCLLLEDGQEPEWCEGERLTSAGGSWTPAPCSQTHFSSFHEVMIRYNVLKDFDENLKTLEDKGVPLDRMILYVTADYKTTVSYTHLDVYKRQVINSVNRVNCIAFLAIGDILFSVTSQSSFP